MLAIYIALTVIGSILLLWFGWGLLSPYIWEQPEYKVEKRLGKTQIRKYAPTRILITETSLWGNAFGVLSSYIFGNNEENIKIAMMTPVQSIRDSDKGTYRMVFFLPKKWKNKKLPAPKGTNITFQTQNSKLIATVRYYGLQSRAKRENAEKILMHELKEHHYFTLGQPFLFQYSDPLVPPPLRRSEVGVIVYKNQGLSDSMV